MKTFEERYTAWIDGQLDGPALTAFELELSRRASAGEARADKTDADRLHQLLTTHLQAPAMTNVEFFSHQLRERVEADRKAGRREERARPARRSLFAWSFGQLAGLGGAFLFVAVALYYGLVPQPRTAATGGVAQASRQVPANVAVAANDSAAPAPLPVAPTLDVRHSSQPIELAQRSPIPPTIDLAPDDIQKVQVPEQSKPTTATPLHYQKPDVNVIWINGLDYMPNVPGESPAAVPAASAQP